MSFSVLGRTIVVCAMLSLSGCSETPLPDLPDPSPVVQVRTPPKKQPELDLADPFDHQDDAAMLRSTPDYSISTIESDPLTPLGIDSGTAVDPLLATPVELHLKPLEVSKVDINTKLGPALPDLEEDAGNLKPY